VLKVDLLAEVDEAREDGGLHAHGRGARAGRGQLRVLDAREGGAVEHGAGGGGGGGEQRGLELGREVVERAALVAEGGQQPGLLEGRGVSD
jgi:hypothetical protein